MAAKDLNKCAKLLTDMLDKDMGNYEQIIC